CLNVHRDRRSLMLPCPLSLRTTLPSVSVSPPAPPQLYTLSLHDALPISSGPRPLRDATSPQRGASRQRGADRRSRAGDLLVHAEDRKSTRLNSSHVKISYAVFCLKKKKNGTASREGGDERWRANAS